MKVTGNDGARFHPAVHELESRKQIHKENRCPYDTVTDSFFDTSKMD
jgi:hypothetical protein